MLILVAVAVLAISAPLRPAHRAGRDASGRAERADLEAARDAKYAEIRDAEARMSDGEAFGQDDIRATLAARRG